MSETKTNTDDLFAMAQVKQPSSKSTEHPTFETECDVTRITQLRGDIKSMTAELKYLEEEAKEEGVGHYKGGSLCLTDGKEKVMILVSDKYKLIDEERADWLSQNGFPNVAKKVTTYTFNSEILNKHKDAISQAILGLDIPMSDKASLLTQKVQWQVEKGAIQKYPTAKGVIELGAIVSLKLQGK